MGADHDPLIMIAGGGGGGFCNSMGNAWTADYLKVTGELDVDLRSNIAAEARANIAYERLIDFCDDSGTQQALQFIMTREIATPKSGRTTLDKNGGSVAKPSGGSLCDPSNALSSKTPVLRAVGRHRNFLLRDTAAFPNKYSAIGFSMQPRQHGSAFP